jgi:hypothetical protein
MSKPPYVGLAHAYPTSPAPTLEMAFSDVPCAGNHTEGDGLGVWQIATLLWASRPDVESVGLTHLDASGDIPAHWPR